MPQTIDPDVGTAGFSIKTAYYLAKAAQAAYWDDLGESVEELGLGEKAATFTFGLFHGFVAPMDEITVLAFRGTDSIQNWLTDGQAAQITDPAYPGQVHQGFARALTEIWPGLTQILPRPASATAVWVTGHSLGAALATLAAVRLRAAGFAVRAVYTFGSPRVGDPDFYRAYTPVAYRFVNNNDIVPHVPLEYMVVPVPLHGVQLCRYKHVGTLEYLDRNGRLGGGMSDWERKKACVLDAMQLAGGLPEPEAISDHEIGNYIKAIATNL
ncbi:MAG: lipase family protein [Thermoguttaceae bacterium]|jgi:triacylglycerol lipase